VHRHGDALASGHNDDVAPQLLSGARLNVAQRIRKPATALCHSNPANRQEGTIATLEAILVKHPGQTDLMNDETWL
jgi:hypothetical protein